MEPLTVYHLNIGTDVAGYLEPRRTDNPCFLYLLKGKGMFKIGETTHLFSTGQCCLIPPHTDHYYWAEEDWKYLWILFDGPLFSEIIPKTAFSIEHPIAECTEAQTEMFNFLYQHRYEYHGQEYYDNLSVVVRLCSSFIASFPSPTQLISDNSAISIRSFIKHNLHRPDLNVKLLMQITGLGRTALYARLKKEGISSINHYIRSHQITKAKHLLRSTELPVSQVAFSVGFEDPLYFSRVFKQMIGSSPSHYREFHMRNRPALPEEKED